MIRSDPNSHVPYYCFLHPVSANMLLSRTITGVVLTMILIAVTAAGERRLGQPCQVIAGSNDRFDPGSDQNYSLNARLVDEDGTAKGKYSDTVPSLLPESVKKYHFKGEIKCMQVQETDDGKAAAIFGDWVADGGFLESLGFPADFLPVPFYTVVADFGERPGEGDASTGIWIKEIADESVGDFWAGVFGDLPIEFDCDTLRRMDPLVSWTLSVADLIAAHEDYDDINDGEPSFRPFDRGVVRISEGCAE